MYYSSETGQKNTTCQKICYLNLEYIIIFTSWCNVALCACTNGISSSKSGCITINKRTTGMPTECWRRCQGAPPPPPWGAQHAGSDAPVEGRRRHLGPRCPPAACADPTHGSQTPMLKPTQPEKQLKNKKQIKNKIQINWYYLITLIKSQLRGDMVPKIKKKYDFQIYIVLEGWGHVNLEKKNLKKVEKNH